MNSQLTADAAALHLFFTDDVYLVKEPDDHRNPSVAQQVVEFKYLGKNKRNILILVNDEHNEVSDEAGRELLRKIVKSVNLSANDFALLNYAGYKGVGFKQLQEYFSCAFMFAFGVTPGDLNLAAHPAHTIVLEGNVKMIFSAGLPVLELDAAGKKALWGSLQNLGI